MPFQNSCLHIGLLIPFSSYSKIFSCLYFVSVYVKPEINENDDDDDDDDCFRIFLY